MSTPFLRALTSSRAPAYPEWSWRVGELKRYPSRFEQQFNAALPSRETIATLSRSVYIDWLGMSPVPEAVLGTDGWLYYMGPVHERLLDRHVRGRAPFAPEELALCRRKLVERSQRFRSIGARYVFVVAPNKESVYPEHLPGWVGPKAGPTRLEQLMADVKAVPDLTVIDLRSSVIADKGVAPLYFKTDTHWNARGAYAAYREIMRVLAPEFPGLVAKTVGELPAEAHRAPGDGHRQDDRTRRIASAEPDFELARSACAERHPLPVPIPAALQSRLTAPAYFTRCDAPGNVDAVVFHDSFGVALAPFLAETFRSSADFSTTAGRDDVAATAMPEALKANLVIEILAERRLGMGPDF